MTEEEIKALKEEKEALEAKLAESEKKRLEQAGNFKKLRDMTKEEKEKLSAVERSLLEQQEKLQEEVDAFQKKQEEFQTSQRKSIVDKYIARLSQGDKALETKLTERFNKYHVDAQSEEQIKDGLLEVYGLEKKGVIPDSLRTAFSSGNDGSAPAINGEEKNPEAEKEIKDLSSMLFPDAPVEPKKEEGDGGDGGAKELADRMGL